MGAAIQETSGALPRPPRSQSARRRANVSPRAAHHRMIGRRQLVVAIAAAAAGWPVVARAQPKNMPLVGVLVLGNPPPDLLLRVFREGLRKRGYVEGRNITLAVRSAEGRAERLLEAARELVRLRADIIVAWQTPAVSAAKQATRDIPIVMAGAGDPIGNGFITSLSRPGGNITGMAGGGADLLGKTIELLREMVPTARRIAVLANAIDPYTLIFVRVLQENAQAAAVELHFANIHPSDDLDRVFAAFAKARLQGLIVQPSLLRPLVADLALRNRLPSISGFRAFAESGGLMSYSTNQAQIFDQAARYVHLILKGNAPAELPVALATEYELVINLKTAKALGLTIPPSLVLRADEVIE